LIAAAKIAEDQQWTLLQCLFAAGVTEDHISALSTDKTIDSMKLGPICSHAIQEVAKDWGLFS
jgi:hypothetical protein